MQDLIRKYKDVIGGGLILLIGTGVVYKGSTYKFGQLGNMGPGFFPVALGALLLVLGFVILLQASRAAPVIDAPRLPAEWRGWICIVVGLLAFAFIGARFGLVPATVAVVAISAFGDRKARLKTVVILTAAMVFIAVVVFWWALKLQLPLLRWG